MVLETILTVKDLKTHFFTKRGVVKAVNGISFKIRKGEVLAIVGESGSGKTVSALSILRLIDSPPGEIIRGEVVFHGRDLMSSPMEELRDIRGKEIAMIFQDPQASLNPVFTVGDQITEQIKLHSRLSGKEVKAKAIELMKAVGIPRPEERFKQYPHQFSGGMQQRIMIAMALSCNPEILIADEPTTALDVTTQAQILELLFLLKEKRGMSILLITHDLGIVAGIADRIAVMYGGFVVEEGTVYDIFDDPKHPYTVGLLDCIPYGLEEKETRRLKTIKGTIPSLIDLQKNCIFNPRCTKAMDICRKVRPGMIPLSKTHQVACHLYSGEKK
ncbi:MAG: ABC transporter ATP-binding protein [Candidatus Hydrothermarchaeales archaeon]